MNALLGRHTLALALGMAIPSLLLRGLSVALHFDVGDLSISCAVLALRGLCSDLVCCWLISVACCWFLRDRRRVYVLWTLGWSLVFAGNVEHIGYNDSNFNVLLAGYATSSEFLTGHVLSGTLLAYCLLASTVTLGCRWWLQRRVLRLGKPRALLAAVSALTLVLCVPTSILYDDWLQESLVETNMKHLFTRGRGQVALASADARGELAADLRARYLSQDLDGVRRFEPGAKKPNVLLILIESLGATYVSEQGMPFLHRFGKENLTYTNFFAHQHLTIKGLYSLLSGDYPNLKYVDCKSDILGTFGSGQPLLPELLSREGYASVFLQGASLGFMRKDLFADSAGFQKIYGADDFESAHRRGPWGVDDRTLFERALEEVEALESPWMMTLLTSGTHPPYNVPPGFRGKSGDFSLEDALGYADEQLEALVEGLRKTGALENTLILITSDEVKGSFSQGIEGALEHYRSPLVVHAPGKRRGAIDEVYGHIDVTLSVLDYLGGVSIPSAIKGRSLFRAYDSPRRLLLGRKSDVVVLEGADVVHFVSNRYDRIGSYKGSDSGYQPVPSPQDLIDDVRQVVEYNDLVFSEIRSEFIFQERKRFLEGSVPVVAQLSISVRRGETLTWEVRLSTKEVARGSVGVRVEAGIPDEDGNYRYIFSDNFDVDPRSQISFSRSFEAPVDIERLDSFILVQTPPGKRAFLDHAAIKRVHR